MTALFLAGCTPLELAEVIPREDPVAWANPADAEDTDPSPDVLAVTLRAAQQTYVIEGREIDGYAYNGQNPGPTLRLKVGDTLNATLINDLDVPTTIHWHGISVPYEMDGVTWSEAPIAPGEAFEYSFQVTQAGTFWYHPHFDTERQVDLGLYGLVIVEDADVPEPDQEVSLVLDSWGDYVPDPDHKHFGTIREWTVNGFIRPQIPVESGDVVHMRILNASNIGYVALTGPFTVIAGDQGWVSNPGPRDHVVMGPGDRIETEWRVGAEPLALQTHPYAMHGGGAYGDAMELATLVPSGTQEAPEGLSWPILPGVPSADGAPDIVYVFQGDDTSGVWMINGEVFPDITIHQLPLGEDAIIEIRNMSAVEHPFHLHGFHFEVLSVNDEPSPHRRIEDTLNIRIRDRVRLKIDVNNPGYWMTHCHILPHAYGGMMTVLHVPEAGE